MVKKRRHQMDLETWSILQAAQFAQYLGLPTGNMWEPAIARYLRREVLALGDAGHVRAFVTGKMSYQLGIPEVDRG